MGPSALTPSFFSYREQAAGAEDQPVAGVPGGQPHPHQLLHFCSDQPGLPACRAVVCETLVRGRGRWAPAENRTLGDLWVRRLRGRGAAAAQSAGREAVTAALRADAQQGRSQWFGYLLLPCGRVAERPRRSLVPSLPRHLRVHAGSSQAARWVNKRLIYFHSWNTCRWAVELFCSSLFPTQMLCLRHHEHLVLII